MIAIIIMSVWRTAGAIAALTILAVPNARAASQIEDDSRISRIDALMRAYTELEQFSGVVLVAEEGRVLYREGLGLADRELGVGASPENRFVIGSMTKAFTAVLVLQQANQGRLQLETPVVAYWPEFPDPSGGKITIRHLLRHRSGLHHWGAVDGFLLEEARLSHEPEEIVELYAEQGLRFDPDEDEAYSSLGYYILGVVLEKVTGKSYGDLLRERIFEPLGMSASALDDHATILPGRVRPYRYNFLEARYDNAEYRDPSTTYATGGIISTVDDLLKWDQALYGERLLPEALRGMLFDPEQGEAAFGWRKIVREGEGEGGGEGEMALWHIGSVTGYRTQITRLPDSRRTVILLTNLRDADVFGMSAAIVDVLYGGELVLPKRSLMKEVLSVSSERGADAAIIRFDEIIEGHADKYRSEPTELLIAAIELRSDDACDRAAPLYEHWLKTYEGHRYAPVALQHAADCRLRLGQLDLAEPHVERLAELNPDHPALPDLRARLTSDAG